MCVAQGCQEPTEDEDEEKEKDKKIGAVNSAITPVVNLLPVITYSLNCHKCFTLSSSHPRCAVLFGVRVEDDHECSRSPGSSRNVDAARFGGDNYDNDDQDEKKDTNNEHCRKNIGIKDLKWDKEVPGAPPENHPEA